MHEQFVIYFERSGGVTGISFSVKIEGNLLEFNEKEKLLEMINNSGFWDYSNTRNTVTNLPDQFEYILTIESGNRNKTIVLKEFAIPEKFQPLFNYLKSQLKKTKK